MNNRQLLTIYKPSPFIPLLRFLMLIATGILLYILAPYVSYKNTIDPLTELRSLLYRAQVLLFNYTLDQRC